MPKPKNQAPDIDVWTPERVAEQRLTEAPPPPEPTPSWQRPRLAAPLPLRQYPKLPPADLVAEHDQELADLIRSAEVAVDTARRAALDVELAGDGGTMHAEAVTAERAHTLAALEVTGDVPGAPSGPLLTFLTETRPHLAVTAARATVRADWCDHRVRTHPRLGAGGKLTEHLDRASDEVEEQMAAGFAAAEQSRDRVDFEQTKKLSRRWAELTSLYLWCLNPAVAFVARPPEMFARRLAFAEYQADTATGGAPRSIVPLEPQDQEMIDRLNRGEDPVPADNRRRR